MTVLSDLIDRMIAAGMSAGEAGSIAAEIYAAGVASVPARTSNAARQQRYRDRKSVTKRNETVTDRNADLVTETVTDRNETVTNNALQNPPISISKNLKSRERQNRGSRIAPDWTPLETERVFAKQEGFSDREIQREAQKFRDYWTACAGAKGVKLDWSATWRQWIRSGADRAGKTPASTSNGETASVGYYAKAESEQLAAWDTYGLRTTGKGMPRDKNQGWRVKSEWPPDHGALPLTQPTAQAAE